jgi:tetratricopeptide (TPR) repeat protein
MRELRSRVLVAESTPKTSDKSEVSGSLSVALNHARRLLDTNPALAEQQADEILGILPDNPEAALIRGIAKRRAGDLNAARMSFATLVAARPHWPTAHYELGLTLAALGSNDEAEKMLARATELNPQMSEAWRALGDLAIAAGDIGAADAFYAKQIKTSVNNPVLIEAAAALVENRLAIAERYLKDFLKRFPTDVAAIRMLAEVAARIGRYADAETLLRRCLELAPGFDAARHNYSVALLRQGKAAEALVEVDKLLTVDPSDPGYRNLKAAVLGHLGDYPRTIAAYADVLRDYPNQPRAWMSYGHALKTAGRLTESIAAYRHSIDQSPRLGEAYWSLANLKTYFLSDADVIAMEAQLAHPDLRDEDRLHFHFALGKALEDRSDFATSFAHYTKGNAIRKEQLGYEAEKTSERVAQMKKLFSRPFFDQRAGLGCEAADPIFIVGLPRSGSTLIEQILSSHSAIEGTMELPDLGAMAMALGGRRKRADKSLYPEILAELDGERLRALGNEYLTRTRPQRKTARPLFIDKTPQNFFHVGMIQLILPNAKIIDARRHPLGACFSGFKQHFARGQAFSYGLDDIGRYYRDYVELMAHFDIALPGKVHRVFYERIVNDTEDEVRRLLEYCGLEFEGACLRFHENDRAVRTPSSEQVRRPIFRDGLDHWRRFEPWLEPLKIALGDALALYPAVPGSAT